MCFWQKNLEKAVKDVNNEGFNSNQLAVLFILTKANKLDKSSDFYIKHIMYTVEWKLNATINKKENLTKKLDRRKRHVWLENLVMYLSQTRDLITKKKKLLNKEVL